MTLSLEQRKKLEDKLFSYYISYYNAYNKRNQVALDDTLDWIEKNINLSSEQFWDKLTLNLDVRKKPSIANLNELKIKGKFYLPKSKNHQYEQSPWTEQKLVTFAHQLDKANLPGPLKHTFLSWSEKCLVIDQETNPFLKQKAVIDAQRLAGTCTNQYLFDKEN